jgi:hypothetical protein
MVKGVRPMSKHDRSQYENLPHIEPPIEQTVDQVAELYHGEWILLQVTERDEHHQPVRGIVRATDPTRRSIQPTVMARLEESKRTGTEYYVFTGYRRLKSGLEWAEALDEIVRRRHGQPVW